MVLNLEEVCDFYFKGLDQNQTQKRRNERVLLSGILDTFTNYYTLSGRGSFSAFRLTVYLC